MSEPVRCPWCLHDPWSLAYHDAEWGVPVRDDRLHFEFLVLESFQAGLSWLTMLKKRENFRSAFRGFDPAAVAAFDQEDVAVLLSDPRIIRNRRKIEAAVRNARAFLRIQERFGSFDHWIWRFTDGNPVIGNRVRQEDCPVRTTLSDTVATELKSAGFAFLGSVTIYAHLQAIGIVNDHIVDCFRFAELTRS